MGWGQLHLSTAPVACGGLLGFQPSLPRLLGASVHSVCEAQHLGKRVEPTVKEHKERQEENQHTWEQGTSTPVLWCFLSAISQST